MSLSAPDTPPVLGAPRGQVTHTLRGGASARGRGAAADVTVLLLQDVARVFRAASRVYQRRLSVILPLSGREAPVSPRCSVVRWWSSVVIRGLCWSSSLQRVFSGPTTGSGPARVQTADPRVGVAGQGFVSGLGQPGVRIPSRYGRKSRQPPCLRALLPVSGAAVTLSLAGRGPTGAAPAPRRERRPTQ